MKSHRVSRIIQILTTLQAGKSYGVGELSKLFQASRRTIFRDLKELQAIGIPYRYDAGSGGYVIDPEFFLPPIDLNLQEALSLLFLAHKAGPEMQIPFRHSALLGALKIENNLPAKMRQYCNTALRKISARVSPQAFAGRLDDTFSKFQKAIAKKRKVSIRYQSLYEGKEIELELCPYHLLYNRRAWYVLGKSSLHKSVRTFKLSRMKELSVQNKCFLDGEKFDLNDYFGKAWKMIPEGRIYNVKLRFLPKVASNVAEVQWHSTQKVARRKDGSAIVEFRVDGLGEISWWVLGYGGQVQVLGPKALRKKIIETAREIIEINKQE